MITLEYSESTKPNKRFKVIISSDNFRRVLHFGQRGAFTYFDGAPLKKKQNYLKRHAIREDWSDPLTNGFHARWFLWSHRSPYMDKIEDSIKKNSIYPVSKITIYL